MASSSSDWLTALLERPEGSDGGSNSGIKTLDWLPDFSKPLQGFEEGLPQGRTDKPEPIEEPANKDDEAEEDPLVNLLREALGGERGENGEDGSDAEVGEQSESGAELEPQSEPEPEPEIDPIAEAFEQGRLAGREQALVEHDEENRRKLQLRQTFRALDQAAMDALAGELSETVVALCTQTLADFIPAPDALKLRCLEAAQRLGKGSSGVGGEATLYLHPEDLTLIDKSGLEGWRLVGDPTAERGGVRLETQDGMVSDRPEDWRRAIAAAIKG